MSKSLLDRLKEARHKLQPATEPANPTQEQPPEAPVIAPEGPQEASEASAGVPAAPRPQTVAGLVPFQEYRAVVSKKEVFRGPHENARQMWIDVEDYGEALCAVSNRHKWRPTDRLTVVFSGRLQGATPMFGHKFGPGDGRRR